MWEVIWKTARGLSLFLVPGFLCWLCFALGARQRAKHDGELF